MSKSANGKKSNCAKGGSESWTEVSVVDAALDGRADLRNASRDKVRVPAGLTPLLGEFRAMAERSRAQYLLDCLERLQKQLSAPTNPPSRKDCFQMNPKKKEVR